MRGKFIVIEGVDGCGSTTVLKELEEYSTFISGPKIYLTREPTEGPVGTLIRLAIKERLEIDPKTLALLFAADRLDHIFEKKTGILKYLDEGFNVICDRYTLSSYAYQGTEEKVEFNWLKQINSKALEPDLIILLDLPAEIALERKKKDAAWNLELYEKIEKLEKVRQKYLELAKAYQEKGTKLFILDATRDKRTIAREVINLIRNNI